MTWHADERVDERVGRILDHVTDGIAVLDRDWRFLYVNAQAGKLLQRDPGTLLGRVLWEEFPDAVGTVFWESYHRAMATEEPDHVEAYYKPLTDWFEVRVLPASEGLTLYFGNVTDRRRAAQEREQLIGRLTTALRRSEQLLELTDALARTLTVDDVADLVTQHAQGALGCRFAGVALIDEDRSVLRYVSMAPLPDEVVRKWSEFPLDAEVPAAVTARSGEPQMFADRAEIVAAYPHIATDLEAAGTDAMANLPLVASGRSIGALMTTWPAPHTCDADELRFLQTLAGQSAQAIGRAQLFARQRSVAATLQRAILPERLPAAATLDLAARYEPAETGLEVGGDWYDAFALADGRMALTVGDVTGHGLEAAALMGQLRNAVRAYAIDDLDPGRLVTKLNRLATLATDSLLATFVFAVLDPATGALRWTNAGHPPPLVVGPAGAARFAEQVHGPPLGADATAEFDEDEEDLAGGALLLYTDGLIEHRGRNLVDGMATLRDVAASTALSDLERSCEELSRRVIPGPREDDACLLLARHVPAGGAAAPRTASWSA